jgi:NAD(P)-dependent dehydrogenase (short-subunit alcohol dehydrogenase family)
MLDASDGDLDRLFEQIEKDKSKLDIVFANAGIASYAPLGTIDEEHFDGIFGKGAPSYRRPKLQNHAL